METKFRVTQLSNKAGYRSSGSDGNSVGYATESQDGDESGAGEEVVDEVAGSSDYNESMSYGTGAEATEAGDLTGHTPMSSPTARPPKPKGESNAEDESAADEATDTESSYESVEGWEPKQATESDAESEPVVEASFADVESSEGSQEFIGAIAAMLVPLAKAVLPTLAGAAVQQGSKLVKSVVKKNKPKLSPSLLQMLRQAGVNPAILKQLEFGEESDDESAEDESGAVDGTTVEALAQQIEALEVVIGVDDRVQIQDTSVVPWKRICHLKIQAANGKSYLGTGFFIGPRTILTAGHCVYIHGQGGWARQIVVSPGRNAALTPFNSYTSTSFRSVQGWVKSKSRNYDYGVIQLSKNDRISPNIGAFGFGQFSDSFLLNKRLNTAGYPGDKPSGTMWFNGRKATSVTDRVITYDIDTAGGQSGSPVWFKGSDGARIVVGIHTNGATSGNSATRITKPVFDNLKKWRAEGGQ